MVLNAAVQMLREADELKQKVLKFKSGTTMLQDRSLWTTQQQLQKIYQKVLVLDLDYALDKKVEQDLWNVGFKQQIDALQSVSKDRKNPSRSEGQAMLSWVLQAAAGFYLCLLHQICTTFKLDLPFRRRASLLGCVEGWGTAATGARLPAAAAARYIAQHCLVHLGDLARYRHQLRVAHTFYRHALLVSVHSGQPYNQLALVARRRGRRLAALYWHARSLLVRAPFPPAPANLHATLHSAENHMVLPVLPGISSPHQQAAAVGQRPLDTRTHVSELIRALGLIHTLEELETASQLVNKLNSSLTALVATDSFEAATLIKMTCVIMWLVHWATEELSLGAGAGAGAGALTALSADEATAALLADSLAAGAVLALLLPAYTLPAPPTQALPALKVWLQWITTHPQLLSAAAFVSRPQLWPALANTLNKLAETLGEFNGEQYATIPLSEDCELHGFLPLEAALAGLTFADRAVWHTYGDRLPETDAHSAPSDITQTSLANEPELEGRVRAHRLIELGRRLAEMRPELLTATLSDHRWQFTASPLGGAALSAALAELSLAAAAAAAAARGGSADADAEADSEEDVAPPRAPTVISEADFREKVREKRVGILKPQGSLERAREERAAATQDDPQSEPEEALLLELSRSEEARREAAAAAAAAAAARRPRMNVAMQAIMRKQEEVNKQVKFVTPPLTPDSTMDTTAATSSKELDKTKILQPKPVKSLANIPVGRKTGGILSLKDKSGYPHLVNTDPKKPDKDEKKDQKTSPPSQNSQQNYAKKQDNSNWGHQAHPPTMPYESPRFNQPHKNYGIQNTGLNYNPNYQAPSVTKGIRLPVVNPKEIDVRSAALQKHNSRQEMYQEQNNQGYQMSGDKRNFLNDLPPRFANQYRHWTAPDTYNANMDNQFRDDYHQNNTMFQQQQQHPQQQQQQGWSAPEFRPAPAPAAAGAGTGTGWWRDTPAPPAAYSAPSAPPLQQYYKPDLPGYLQPRAGFPGAAQFGGSFAYAPPPAAAYDAGMYPQFNELGYQGAPPRRSAAAGNCHGKELLDVSGLGFNASVLNMHRGALGRGYGAPQHDVTHKNSMDPLGTGVEGVSSEAPGNTYSLFSGAPETGAWGAVHQPPPQSLWSGPGPSPLERLLEQQKQMKHPPEPH